MTPERYGIVKSAFEACAGLSPGERSHALSAYEPDIRAEVESLLTVSEEAGDFLATPAVELGRIGAYQIVRKVGEGGMGAVYEGHRVDGGFEQRVAIKLIRRGSESDDLLTRFHAERQLLARLEHPNICRLLDGGTTEDGRPYFVLEFIEGETLDVYCTAKQLSVWQRALLLQPVCAAVEYLHANGILHRDLKPRNIMVTAAGIPKLLDFGIAKAVAENSSATLTNQHLATPRYASPEQLAGKALTQQSDVYSLGTILIELMGDDAPPALRIIAAKAMQPDPDCRHASAGALATAIERAAQPQQAPNRRAWIAAAVAATAAVTAGAGLYALRTRPRVGSNSVAVLPFADFSEKRDQDPFCDGITEEIIDNLTRLPGLRVVARTSVFEYKGKPADVRRIAEQLGVETVVEGSIRKQGDQMRITVQHVRAADGMHLWSQTFDRPVKDVFAVQREISAAVAERLGGQIGVQPRIPERDLEAYRLYLEGRHLFNQGFTMPPLFEKAIPLLEQAVQRDRSLVLAYTTLADCHIYLGDFEMRLPSNTYLAAKQWAQRALAIDPDSAEAHMSHAVAMLQGEWRAKAAEKELALAMRSNPGSAFIQHWHAHSLEAQGKLSEALEEMKAAQRDKDPLALYLFWDIANMAGSAGRIEEARAAVDRSMQLHPHAPMTHFMGAMIETASGNPEGARAADRRFREALAGQPDFVMAPYRASSAALGGDTAEARRLLTLIERSLTSPAVVVPASLFVTFLVLGDYESALRSLERSYRQRNPNIYSLSKVPPVREARKRDPRIAKILDEVERQLSVS